MKQTKSLMHCVYRLLAMLDLEDHLHGTTATVVDVAVGMISMEIDVGLLVAEISYSVRVREKFVFA